MRITLLNVLNNMNWILDPTNRMVMFMIAVAAGSIGWLIHELFKMVKSSPAGQECKKTTKSKAVFIRRE
jgi:hypothetical protein